MGLASGADKWPSRGNGRLGSWAGASVIADFAHESRPVNEWRRRGQFWRTYGQRVPVRATRTRPPLAKTASTALRPDRQTVKVPICKAPFTMRVAPNAVYET